MKICQLTQTDPIELARAVLTADDLSEFPPIHQASLDLLRAVEVFNAEHAHFDFEDEDDAE